MTGRMQNRVGWVGLLFVVLLVAVVAIFSAEPASAARLASVVSYYSQHENTGYVGAFMLELAVVALSFFWYLRNVLMDVGADARLTMLAFAGPSSSA